MFSGLYRPSLPFQRVIRHSVLSHIRSICGITLKLGFLYELHLLRKYAEYIRRGWKEAKIHAREGGRSRKSDVRFTQLWKGRKSLKVPQVVEIHVYYPLGQGVGVEGGMNCCFMHLGELDPRDSWTPDMV